MAVGSAVTAVVYDRSSAGLLRFRRRHDHPIRSSDPSTISVAAACFGKRSVCESNNAERNIWVEHRFDISLVAPGQFEPCPAVAERSWTPAILS